MWKYSAYNLEIREGNRVCVLNTMTGALICLSNEEFDNIKQGRVNEKESFYSTLIEEGILIDSNIIEEQLLRHAYTYAKYNKNKSHLTICPTLDCNFICPYCYEAKECGKMDDNVKDGRLKYIEDLLIMGIEEVIVTWYGGEPLLYPDIIVYLSMGIKKLCELYNVKFTQSMISNGHLLNKKNVSLLKSLNINKVQITVDGDKTTHDKRRMLKNGGGTYSTIIKNINELSKSNIKVIVRVNIDRSNINALNDVINKFIDVNNVYCYPALVTLEENQSLLQKKRCYGYGDFKKIYYELEYEQFSNKVISSLVGVGVQCCFAEHCYSSIIDYKGNIYKCLNDIGKTKYKVGSIFDKKQNEVPISIYMGRDPFSEEECRSCVYLPICYGGCANEYFVNGKHKCISEKYLIEKFIKDKYMGSVK